MTTEAPVSNMTPEQMEALVSSLIDQKFTQSEGYAPVRADGMGDEDPRTGMLKPFREGDVEKMTIYSMTDGSASYTYKHWAEEGRNAYLRRRLPNGKPAFTANKDEAPKPPALRFWCWLSENYGARDEIVGLGLGHILCSRRSGLRSEMDVQRHMERKHKDEYRLIQDSQASAEREEDRAFQRQQLELMTAAIKGSSAATDRGNITIYECPREDCMNENGERSFFQSEKSRDAHMRTHAMKDKQNAEG